MTSTAAWITGALMGLISLFGLILARLAVDGAFHFFGLLLFLFGVLMVFALIAATVGRREAD